MCIIAVKRRNIAPPSRETWETMMRENPDGFSCAVSTNSGGWIYFRTLEAEKMMKFVDKISAEQAFIFHARIKTHGQKKIENCHGWRDARTGIRFFHNGILTGIHAFHDRTDSETFFRTIFSPLYAAGKWKAATPAINAIIGASKFAFALPNGKIRIFGNYEENDGIFYSNDSFRETRYPDIWGRFSHGRSYANTVAAAAPSPKPAEITPRRTKGGFSEQWHALPETCEAPF